MIEEILPPAVAAVETFEDLTDVTLFPAEEAVLTQAVDRRRLEFATGRACARAALAQLGLPPVAIVPGPKRAPQWPPGVTGSITHCHGYRAAAVARVEDVVSLGLDAEPDGPLPDGVGDVITLEEERGELARLAAEHPGVHWDRLLFCAKEAVYKAWFPLTGRWLDFKEASITFDPATTSFSARLLVPGPLLGDRELSTFPGRWLARRNLLITAIALLP